MYIRYYVLGGVFLLGLLFSSCGNSSPEEVAVELLPMRSQWSHLIPLN